MICWVCVDCENRVSMMLKPSLPDTLKERARTKALPVLFSVKWSQGR
jgi:hypothetical protein